MSYPYIISSGSLSLVIVIDNISHTVPSNHPMYTQIVAALKREDWETIKTLVNLKEYAHKYSNGELEIDGDTVRWAGIALHNSLTIRIVEMLRDGYSIAPMIAFLSRLMKNSSYRAVNELYTLLENSDLPITPDGYLLAYKKVSNLYMDLHSGTILNKPAPLLTPAERQLLTSPQEKCGKHNEVSVELRNGETYVSMPRNMVDDNKNVDCSIGLHFCSLKYITDYFRVKEKNDRIVIVRVDPADVVSIPTDCNHTKGRTCAYAVIGELQGPLKTAFPSSVHESHTITGIDPNSVVATSTYCHTESPSTVTAPAEKNAHGSIWKQAKWPGSTSATGNPTWNTPPSGANAAPSDIGLWPAPL